MRSFLALLFVFSVTATTSLAVTPTPTATPTGYPVIVQLSETVNQADFSIKDFLAQVIATIQNFGGIPWMLKVAVGCLVFVGLLKVSFLNELIWNRLGRFKAFAAPIAGLLAGLMLLGADHQISLAGVFAYLGSGLGAVMMHELLDAVKAIPGIGQGYVTMIEAVQRSLGGKPKV